MPGRRSAISRIRSCRSRTRLRRGRVAEYLRPPCEMDSSNWIESDASLMPELAGAISVGPSLSLLDDVGLGGPRWLGGGRFLLVPVRARTNPAGSTDALWTDIKISGTRLLLLLLALPPSAHARGGLFVCDDGFSSCSERCESSAHVVSLLCPPPALDGARGRKNDVAYADIPSIINDEGPIEIIRVALLANYRQRM